MDDLSKIEKIDLRKVWKNEAFDFTKWLSEPENISLLSDEIGVEFYDIETEADVGSFSVDLLAEEEVSGNKVIIENQLEATDHDHLGKLITYASGYDASIIIWIVKSAREEHRQAVDWLNENTGEGVNFFLVKLEVWQIGDSPYAPKFDVISKPNEWAKSIKKRSKGKLTETKEMQLKFWTDFSSFLDDNNASFKPQSPRPKHWTNISIGSSEAHLALSLNSFENAVRTEFYIKDRKDLFYFLENNKENIENDLGMSLVWQELPEKKASRIKAEIDGNIENEEDWDDYFEWLYNTSEKFIEVFPKYLDKFDSKNNQNK